MPKAELISTLAYGDGKPLDVGFDRAIANNLNLYHNAKSRLNAPLMVSGTEAAFAGLAGFAMADVTASLFIYPLFFGLEHLTSAVTRVVTVSPWFRSTTGATAEVRVTLTDQIPQPYPGVAPGDPTAGPLGDPMFQGRVAQSATWSTTSTTWSAGAEVELSLGVKADLGFVFVVIEGSGVASCRGLAKCHESAKRTA